MTLALVQNPALVLGSATLDTSWTYTWGTNPTVGNKIIFGYVLSTYPSGNVTATITATDNATTPNTYNVRQQSAGIATGYEAVLIVEADIAHLPASGSLVVTFSSSAATYHSSVQAEFSGLAASSAYDTGAKLSSETISGTTIAVGPTATLAQAAEMAFSVYSIDGGSASSGIAVPSGWTSLGICQDASTYFGLGGAYEVVAATTAVTANWTASTNTNGTGNYGSLATFKISAGGGTTYTATLTASSTTSASKVSAVKVIRSASSTATAAKIAAVSALRSASSTTAGVIVKSARSIRSAASTAGATIASIKTKLLTLAAAVTSGAAIQRAVGAVRSAATSAGATAVKRVNAIRSAASTTTATLSAIKTKLLTLSASVTSTAARVAAVQAIRSASTVTAGTAVKAVRVIRSAASAAGAVATKAVSATKAATATSTAALATIKAKLLTLSAAVSTSATASRAVAAVRSASAACIGALQKKVSLIRAAASTTAATIATAKAKLLTLTASISSSGSVVRATMAVRATATTTSAGMVKLIRATRSASTGALAFLILVAHRVLAFAGDLIRVDRRPTVATVDARSTVAVVDARRTILKAERGTQMARPIDKRTADNRQFDIDCSDLLQDGVTIVAVASVTATLGGMTFGSGAPSTSPLTYKDESGTTHTVPAGQAIQVQISGGTIPPGQQSLTCTGRAIFSTATDPAVDATFLIRLIDTPNVY